jgi:hypothetical protein
MVAYDAEARRQICRERADELAREMRLARGPHIRCEQTARAARGLAQELLALLGRLPRYARKGALASGGSR